KKHNKMAKNGESSSSSLQEPMSPAAQLFHEPRLNCYIIAVMGSKTCIDPITIKEGLHQTLVQHPRFSSKLVAEGKKMKWKRTVVNLEDHIVVPKLDGDDIEFPADRFVEDYISHLTTIPMDLSKPLWELHILNVKTSDAESIAVFRIHHSMGDGASLISLLLACTRKTSDPEALPTVPTQKRAGSGNKPGGFWWFFLAFWTVLRMMWNTLVDLVLLGATMLFLKDTTTPLKGTPPSGFHEPKPKKIVYRIVSLDDIKLMKNAVNMTINDVITGVVQAGLSRYLNRKYGENKKYKEGERANIVNLPKGIRLRATVLVNLRPAVGIQALADLMAGETTAKWGWGNWIGYILLPFTIALQDNPLDYLQSAKSTISRKKHSLESIITFQSAMLVLKLFGTKVTAAILHKVLSNTTLAFSNVVGPVEEISFFGHPIAFLSPTVYGNPQALTIHFQSYSNKMIIVLAVDPDVIPDPHILCDDIQESLQTIKDAVLRKGSDAV
ncbi:hypothetical protein Tsubulata_032813, partial [Turnera subulata]